MVLLLIAILLWGVSPTPAAAQEKAVLKWLGNAGWEIQVGKTIERRATGFGSTYAKGGKERIEVKTYRQWIALLVTISVVIIAAAGTAISQDQPGTPASTWLTGKWAGPTKTGDELVMDLRVEGDNEVKGMGSIQMGGRSRTHPIISGTVHGDKVVLEVRYASTGTVVRYVLEFVDGTLTGTSPEQRFKATFKKLE